MMIGVYQGRHIGEEVAGMGSPCGWGDVLLLLDILLLLEVLLLMELAVETLQEDEDDDDDYLPKRNPWFKVYDETDDVPSEQFVFQVRMLSHIPRKSRTLRTNKLFA